MSAKNLNDAWNFPWSVMEVLLLGKSSIDMEYLQVESEKEATEFVEGYGFDPSNPRDQRLVHGNIVEAINFIMTYLITPRDRKKGIIPPVEITSCYDARQLLVWATAAESNDPWLGAWACAVLRVVHTISHIEGVIRYTSIDVARDQIMKRFDKNIFRGQDGVLYLGSEDEKVQLDRVEWKHHKTRSSIILKLLHKKDNVAETIYDQLGVRIVTSRLCDVMQVVKFLRTFHLVTYSNCVPSRSRSSLIDLEDFRQYIQTIQKQLARKEISEQEFASLIAGFTHDREQSTPISSKNVGKSNVHSSSAYRSIQLTCRQLIRTRNPELGWLDKIKEEIDVETIHPKTLRVLNELRTYVEYWHSVRDVREVTSFFPFEIQIIDRESYSKVLSGEATHDRYKQSQIRAARKRVLGAVFEKVRQGDYPKPKK